MGKYDNLFSQLTQEKKDELKSNLLRDARALLNDRKITSEMVRDTADWENQGIDKLDTVFVGPFTAKEYLNNIGIDLSKYDEWANKTALIAALAKSEVTASLAWKKGDKGEFVITASEEAQKAFEPSKDNSGAYTLTFWDRFCNLIGIKTSHARSVEMNIAIRDAYNEKIESLQRTINNKAILKKHAAETHEFLRDNKNRYDAGKAVIAQSKKQFDAWNKVFFGNKKVPDYILNNGKKVSPVSLCLMVLHQRSDMNLSKLSPESLAKRMENNPAVKTGVEGIGKLIGTMATKKAEALNKEGRFKYLDDFLFETNNELSTYDNKLKSMLKPKQPRALNITVADEFSKLTEDQQEKKAEIFGKSCVLFKAKDDMIKIFGAKEQTYNMKNSNGESINKAAENMEKLVKNTFDAVNVYDAIQNDQYDKAFKTAGMENDYNKLKNLYEFGTNILRETNSSLNIEAFELPSEDLNESVVYDDLDDMEM